MTPTPAIFATSKRVGTYRYVFINVDAPQVVCEVPRGGGDADRRRLDLVSEELVFEHERQAVVDGQMTLLDEIGFALRRADGDVA